MGLDDDAEDGADDSERERDDAIRRRLAEVDLDTAELIPARDVENYAADAPLSGTRVMPTNRRCRALKASPVWRLVASAPRVEPAESGGQERLIICTPGVRKGANCNHAASPGPPGP